MSWVIPLNTTGNRLITVDFTQDTFMFRTYYVMGQKRHWCMDIYDADETPIVLGLILQPGTDNLIKGHGNKLDGYAINVFTQGDYSEPESPGTNLYVELFEPGEKPFVNVGDPMDNVGKNIWYRKYPE